MGLDMYLVKTKEVPTVNPTDPASVIFAKEDDGIEVAYWRKFNALHDFFFKRYEEAGGTTDLNCYFFPVTIEILNNLTDTCKSKKLTPVAGFFFGSQEPVTDGEYQGLLAAIPEWEKLIKEGYALYYFAFFFKE